MVSPVKLRVLNSWSNSNQYNLAKCESIRVCANYGFLDSEDANIQASNKKDEESNDADTAGADIRRKRSRVK